VCLEAGDDAAVPSELDVPAACGGVAVERGDAGELGLQLRPDQLDVKRLRGLAAQA
jgi:hypothetical protein